MSDCEDSTSRSSPPEDRKVEKCEAEGENGLEPFTDPDKSLLLPQTSLLIPFSSDTQKTQGNTPLPATSSANDLQSLSGCSENTQNTEMVLSGEKEYELADAQAEQTGDTEQVKRYYLTAKKLDSIVEPSKREELKAAGAFLHPSESMLDKKQNVLPQCTEEPLAVTKYSGSVQDEDKENSSMVPDQETLCADPIMRSAKLETDDMISVPTLQSPLYPDSNHQYNQLIERLHQQEKKCRRYCQQFSHMGNITELTKFERLVEECVSHVEALREAKGKGYPVPKFHMEDRTINVFKIIPELSGSDMLLTIVRGVNLPLPEDISPNELETSVRFEFPFPSLEEAQRDQTCSIKNSSSPEFGEQFTLHIKRSHRGLKRVVQSKGIKFEIIQKGGLFKTDKVLASAQLKLDPLESECEIRQLLEVFKRRTPTGGHLEVRVKIREPLGGPQSELVTEKWLVFDPLTLPLVAATKPQVQDNSVKRVNNRSSTCSVL